MKEALDLLAPLAAKLGTTIEYLWTALIYQGCLELAKSIVMFVAGIYMLKRGLSFMATAEKDPDHSTVAAVISLIAIVLGPAFIICAFVMFQIPQMWAIKTVFSALGGSK